MDKNRRGRKRAKSIDTRKDTGKRTREQTKLLQKLQNEELKLSEVQNRSEVAKSSFSELNKQSDTSSREVHFLNTRLQEEKAKGRDVKEMLNNQIKQLTDQNGELIVRHEGQINSLKEQIDQLRKDLERSNEEIRQQRELFSDMLSNIKSAQVSALAEVKNQQQERIDFMQQMLQFKPSDEPIVVISKHYAFIKKYWALFASDEVNDTVLYNLGEQLENMDELEIRNTKGYVSRPEFWQYYVKFRVPQFATYTARAIYQGSRTKQRLDYIIQTLTKYSEIYKRLGYPKFEETLISKAYMQAKDNPEFGNLAEASSYELAAKVIKAVGKAISGIIGVNFKTDRKPQPKDLVAFEALAKCVMAVKKNGYDIAGIDQYSSRIFAFFLGLCIVTGQRNRTVREVKFEDFVAGGGGKFYVFLFASKTRKQAKYTISKGVYDQVQAIKEARAWMNDELAKANNIILKNTASESHKVVVKEKIGMIQRRIDHVFPFFRSNAVHWHAARFRQYMVDRQIENAKFFTIHTVRAIALTQIAYSPQAASLFAQHSNSWVTQQHYVPSPFIRDMIKGIDFDELIQPVESDLYIEKLMNKEKKDEEYEQAMVLRGKQDEESD